MIWIDAVILILIFFYAMDGYRRGFIRQAYDLVSLVVSFVAALKFYEPVASFLVGWGLNQSLTKPVAFLALWGLSQAVLYFLGRIILCLLPCSLDSSKINQSAGVLPGIAKGAITIAIILMILVILPLSSNFRNQLMDSRVAGFLVKSTSYVADQLENALGGLTTSLTSLRTNPKGTEKIELNFRTDQYKIDPASEEAMVAQVNAERAKAGLVTLKVDENIRAAARKHSIDMAKNGYFSHENLNGQSPFDRLLAGGVIFGTAGENIALAPTYELAQIGFMNSPDHRANILESNFRRVGIGIIDLGAYGRMVTQDFAD